MVLDLKPRLRSGPRITGRGWRKRTRILLYRRVFVVTEVGRICGRAVMAERGDIWAGNSLYLHLCVPLTPPSLLWVLVADPAWIVLPAGHREARA